MTDQAERIPLYLKVLGRIAPGILWFGRVFLKWNRLDHIDLIPLETPMEQVIEESGEPIETEPNEKFPESIRYTFNASPFHEAVICEWRGKACSITYWSSHSAPIPDLKHMLKKYRGDSLWNDTEPGYWYFREDGKVRLWCSVAPAIGVATTEYLKASSDAERALNSTKAN